MGPLEPISPGWNIMRTWFPAVTVTKHMSAETFLLWIRTFFELACKTFKRTHDEITQNSPKSHTALHFVIKHINRVLSSPFFIFYFFLLEALECVTFRSDREKRDEVVFGWCIPVINANWQWTRALQQKVAPSETSIWWPPQTSLQTASSSVMAAPPWEGCQLGDWHTSVRISPDVRFLIP